MPRAGSGGVGFAERRRTRRVVMSPSASGSGQVYVTLHCKVHMSKMLNRLPRLSSPVSRLLIPPGLWRSVNALTDSEGVFNDFWQVLNPPWLLAVSAARLAPVF